jgi:hypothetical protein
LNQIARRGVSAIEVFKHQQQGSVRSEGLDQFDHGLAQALPVLFQAASVRSIGHHKRF